MKRTCAVLMLVLAAAAPTVLQAQIRISVPDNGWHLWLDTAAAWQQDSLILLQDPSDLSKLRVNPPTGGWGALTDERAITVTLPSTVEEHFWGVRGLRPYANGEYAFEAEDSTVRNGNYLGVSWWWRDLEIPRSFAGKHVVLFIRGARLKAEVFVNEQLVGYNILTELPFECDVSRAMRPGAANRLAVRITNPGGRLDWVDTELLKWGTTDQTFHKSHGFGGVDRGIELRALDPVHIADAWVLNTPRAREIESHVIIRNLTPSAQDVRLRFEIVSADAAHIHIGALLSRDHAVRVRASGVDTVVVRLRADTADLWSVDTPVLYRLNVRMNARSNAARPSAQRYSDSRDVTFGFRWFDAEGITQNAQLVFNGRRIRLTSAISWGFWGVNGLWPSKELAEREVAAAKAFGMNCIQFHRNVGKAEMLDAQDRLGLLRYMEPGGGQTAFGDRFSLYAPSPKTLVDPSGAMGDAQTFAERYMEEKIVRMVRAHRSHPSLVMYAIQNEIHPDLNNPRVFRILHRIHEEDPSRIVVVKSGFPSGKPSTNQAWMKPYSNDVMLDSGTAYTGWWDDHTVGGPGVWRDEFYKGPEDFTHRSTNDREIVVWGEMLGAAVTDNHSTLLDYLRAHGGKSYDLRDHEEILGAYNRFLDRWGFRSAFPTASALFMSIGNKSYDFWGRVIETARLAEANDYFVISGWESTAIENHSGLVDNLRGFKGNPALIKTRLAPMKPVIKMRSLVYMPGDTLSVDLYLLNETDRPHTDSLALVMREQDGTSHALGTYAVPAHQKNRFVYPVRMNIPCGILTSEGEYTISASARRPSGGAAQASEKFLVVRTASTITQMPKRIGIISSIPAIKNLRTLFWPGVVCEPYEYGKTYDAVIAANRFVRPLATKADSASVPISNTDDDELYRTINYGEAGAIEFLIPGLPTADTARVTLKFAELFQNAVDMRVFDVAINGQVVLKDFDVFKAAGGKFIAFDTAFTVPLTDGAVQITFPRTPKPSARISGIRIDTRDTVVAINCGGSRYTDARGLVWRPYEPPTQFDQRIFDEVRKGLPLVVLSEGDAATETYGRELSKTGAFEYKGYLGESRASWMGSWYFVRHHPLYDGLPVNTAMQSYYQVPVTSGSGLFVDGADVEIVAGYSRDHSREIGAGSFTTKLGAGRIVVHTIPGMVSQLSGQVGSGIHPVMFRRLLSNSLIYAAQ